MIVEFTRRELIRAMFASAPMAKLREVVQSTADTTAPELRRVALPVPGLDRRLDGLRIGQVSDVHVGALLGPDHLQRALALFGRAPPEVMTATGDLLDDPRKARACFDLLAAQRAPYGVFYSLGNHENFQDRDHIIATARAHDTVRILVNEETTVTVQGATVHVGGVDFPVGQGATAPRDDVNRAGVAAATQRSVDADLRIALAHHPDDFDELASRGVELTLSGHTHGGQIAAFGQGLTSRWFKYFYGHYQQGRSHLWVSGGTGHSFPLRVGVPMEVTEITLRRV
ncbi:MAG: metallophosphoesterase [Deltaproteobacteria bacterium]|nr:metallophosphoesterase [Deltaproteobacteria bacterium]